MITVGIKELKNSLSRYLVSVKNGEDILITDRGKLIARIIPEKPERPSLRKSLQPLIMTGVIEWPERPRETSPAPPIKVGGKSVSEMVIEDRR